MATPEEKQVAYDKYINAETEGTKISYPNSGVLSNDFVNFCQTWTFKDPFSVDVSHLGSVGFPEEIFYRVALSETFHTYYSGDVQPPAYGAGNYQNVRYHRDGSKYTIKVHGLNMRDWTLTFNNPTFELTGDSLTLKEGLVKVTLKVHDNEGNGCTTPGGQNILNLQVHVYGRLHTSYYLVPFKF